MWLCLMDKAQQDLNHCQEVNDWTEIEVIIDSMDVGGITWVQIGIGEDGFDAKWFDLISGNKKRVKVFYRSDDEDYGLLDLSQTEHVMLRNVPYHQWDDLAEPSSIVDKTLAKHVLKHFYEHHERLIDGVLWE